MLQYSLLHPKMQVLFYELVGSAIREIGEMYNVPGAAVYFCDEIGHPRMHEVFGVSKRHETVLEFSMEKAIRLRLHPEHTSSWQSRNPKEKKYSGAIRFPNSCILSISAFEEEVDEASAAAIGSLLGWVSETQIEDILIPHGNHCLFETIRERIRKNCL